MSPAHIRLSKQALRGPAEFTSFRACPPSGMQTDAELVLVLPIEASSRKGSCSGGEGKWRRQVAPMEGGIGGSPKQRVLVSQSLNSRGAHPCTCHIDTPI